MITKYMKLPYKMEIVPDIEEEAIKNAEDAKYA